MERDIRREADEILKALHAPAARIAAAPVEHRERLIDEWRQTMVQHHGNTGTFARRRRR